jgi:hypothetical protein
MEAFIETLNFSASLGARIELLFSNGEPGDVEVPQFLTPSSRRRPRRDR